MYNVHIKVSLSNASLRIYKEGDDEHISVLHMGISSCHCLKHGMLDVMFTQHVIVVTSTPGPTLNTH